MVTRLMISPETGFLMSRPGVDVTETDKHRLMDQRFPSLEVHEQGGGDMPNASAIGSLDEWNQTWTYPDLGYVPIGFVSATFGNQADRVTYPATLPPIVSYDIPGPGIVNRWNEVEIMPDSIRVRIFTVQGAPPPNVQWIVFKNPRLM